MCVDAEERALGHGGVLFAEANTAMYIAVSLSGLPVEPNYVQLCTCKKLQGHYPPPPFCHIIMLSGISSLPSIKHRWHIGIDVFRTKWAMNIVASCKTISPQKQARKKITSLTKLCEVFFLSLHPEKPNDSLSTLAKVVIGDICPVRRLVPAWLLILIVKVICCYVL